ncbi:hypothetical protein [Pacificibacter marinus]|uniref:hypothetical protein n=1 Tax=Pacificibacter marinus TaxID=658057 RepID=UPI001C07EDA9|nr:hypothetical protein [Pacificibacter marinus]MBU2866373.1 hypothetical protein [Pacificibacter marinus]
MSFFQSKRFREAWMGSLILGCLFPFLEAISLDGSEQSYLARVNDGFLPTAFKFAAIYFVIVSVFAVFKHRRDAVSSKSETSE